MVGSNMREHYVGKPGLLSEESSSAMGSSGTPRGRGSAIVAVFAMLGLTLDGLGSGTVLIDVAGFERYCRVVDSSAIAVALQLLVGFGPAMVLLVDDFRTSNRRPGPLGWRGWGARLLGMLAVAHLLSYVAILRAPWLLVQASCRSRVDVWSARLSSTVGGVPMVSFLQAIGLGSLLIATGAAALRTLHHVDYLQTPTSKRRLEVAVWILCAGDFLLGLATIATFATGGFS